jgi:hypothetical protein
VKTAKANQRCYSCKDEAIKSHKGKNVCLECFNELKHGRVINQNVNFFGGRAGPMEDDGGPWQQNAVRDMEGN